jgi:hypothetical protein
LIDTGQCEMWFYRDTADNINTFLYKGNVLDIPMNLAT